MSYISLLVAYLMTNDSSATGDIWMDQFFDNLVTVELSLFTISWYVMIGAVILAILFFAYTKFGGGEVSFGCGCMLLFLAILPLLEWITLQLAQGMAESWGPEGVINQGQLLISIVLYLFLGAG